MDIRIEKLEKCQTKVVVTTNTETWKSSQEKAFKQIAAKTEIKGFRKGHAPENIVKAHINKAEVLRTASDTIIDEAYQKAVKEHNLRPFYQPELNITKLDEDNFEFELVFTGAPEVTLGEYKNIVIKKDKVEVTDEDVNKKIDELLNKNVELEVVENGSVEHGNTVVLDFEGFVDGKAFDGGKAENFSLEIGSNTFIPGFEDQLIGMKSGEEGEINVKFPEKYVEHLANKDATFKVKIHEIKRKVIPTLNDEFVKEADIENVNTVEELKAYYKKQVEEEKNAAAADKQVTELVNKVCENATFEVSDKIVEEEAGYMVNNFKGRIEQQGLSYAEYLKMTNQTEDQILTQAKDEAVKNLKQMFVLHQIGLKEDIKVSDEEVNAELENMSKMYQMSVDDVKKALGGRMDQISNELRNRKIVNYLKENNVLD